ncbi:hypothetical protein JOB18_031181 [Solea senegalensis]|uniref:Uncharacterized protein n=1 Tax=Solea senegalensis TaxID=28829 RepID=A0AAV6PHV9_SOLSE|nr:hypothetical protein JOB18_031181 [Solea senegalensis]
MVNVVRQCDSVCVYLCRWMMCLWTSLVLVLSLTPTLISSIGLVPGVSLYEVVWDHSETLAESILRSSSVLSGLQSGHLTKHCYVNFLQQEALYLHSASSTLEAVIGRLQESGDVRSLLQDTLTHYSSRNLSLAPLPSPPPPLWLQFSLQSLRSVVLDEPVYWLVALSARASLRSFLVEELLNNRPGPRLTPETVGDALFQEWSKDSLKEVTWTRRFKGVLDKHQSNTDMYKAINIFRDHMMNQKSFYKAVDCEAADEEE